MEVLNTSRVLQTVAVVCGGPSLEHEVSLISAKNVAAALAANYNVVFLGMSPQGQWFFGQDDSFFKNASGVTTVAINPESSRVQLLWGGDIIDETTQEKLVHVDVCFPVMHGTYGEDGALQGFLQLLNIPCVGAGSASSAVCMDKVLTKQLLEANGIAVAPYHVAYAGESVDTEHLVAQWGLPIFVKPARCGSSVGVSRVDDAASLETALAEAWKHDDKALIEKAISGKEVECAVLGKKPIEAAEILGEIIPTEDFYSYDAKYVSDDGALLQVPAHVSAETAQQVRDIAIKTFQVLDCAGMARVDFFVTEDNAIVVNEINTLPGFTSISMYPKLWEVSGKETTTLCRELVALAQQAFQQEHQKSGTF